MRIVLVGLLCAVSAVAGTSLKSEKYPPPSFANAEVNAQLEELTFNTQLDHFRPQEGKSIQFVS